MMNLHLSIPLKQQSSVDIRQAVSFPCESANAEYLAAAIVLSMSACSGKERIECVLDGAAYSVELTHADTLETISSKFNSTNADVLVEQTTDEVKSDVVAIYSDSFSDPHNEAVTHSQQGVTFSLHQGTLTLFFLTSIYSKEEAASLLEFACLELKGQQTRVQRAMQKQENLFKRQTNQSSTGISEQFIAAVTHHPEKIAIVDDAKQLTYRELHREVTAVARHLMRLSLDGQRVAVALERSHHSLIALLAINYAGAVYVPFDPQYPEQHCRVLISQLNIQAVLHDNSQAFYHTISNAINLCELKTSPSQHLPPTVIDLDREFAVLFTSGSTGRAKAIVHSERSFVERFAWQWRVSPITHQDVVAQRTNIGFGPHIWEFLGTVLKGAKLVIVHDTVAADPDALAKCIEDYQITRLSLVPSIAKLLINAPHIQANCQSIKVCSLAGESYDMSLVDSLRSVFLGCEIFNDFGSTECNCIFFNPLSGKEVTLGKASDAALIRVISESGQPCFPFQKGILHVSGPTLAKGYIAANGTHQPLPSNEFGFTTGDRVFYDNEGHLYPLGRNNNIVKIRGMRVDLLNVENQLQQVLNCEELRLVSRKKADGETQIIAFYIGEGLNPVSLYRQCQSTFPPHYCPAYFKRLSVLPKLANGKLDRVKLMSQFTQNEAAFDESTWGKLAQLVCQISELPLSRQELHDCTLSELGVDSLSLLKLVNAIKLEFNHQITLSALSELNSLADLALHLDGKVATVGETKLQRDLADLLACYEASHTVSESQSGQAVLLTGASGFIGAFMLASLLPDHQVYCPVRATSDEEARRKIERNMATYGLTAALNDNLQVFKADLTHDFFGLSEVGFLQLVQQVNAVYHVAAEVNHVQGYSALRETQLRVWQNLMPFLKKPALEQFHFFSSVAVNKLNQGIWHEESIPANGHEIASGYGKSKWLGEQFLHQIDTNASIRIYRIGEVGGSLKTGHGRSDDFVHNLLALMASLGSFPAELVSKPLVVDMLPVDWLVEFIQRQPLDGETVLLNLRNLSPQPLHSVLQDLGCKEDNAISWSDWLNALHQQALSHSDKLLNVLPYYTTPLNAEWLSYFSTLDIACHKMQAPHFASLTSPTFTQMTWSMFAKNWQKQGLNFKENKGAKLE